MSLKDFVAKVKFFTNGSIMLSNVFALYITLALIGSLFGLDFNYDMYILIIAVIGYGVSKIIPVIKELACLFRKP